jgi:hypothetical protein
LSGSRRLVVGVGRSLALLLVVGIGSMVVQPAVLTLVGSTFGLHP